MDEPQLFGQRLISLFTIAHSFSQVKYYFLPFHSSDEFKIQKYCTRTVLFPVPGVLKKLQRKIELKNAKP